MKNKILILTQAEFKRSWTRTKIIVVASICLFLCLLTIIPAIFNLFESIPIPVINLTDYMVNVWKMLVPFAVFFFTVGIISTDVKNHWIRTLMIHSLTRQEIALAKMFSALSSVFIIMLILGLIPILVFLYSNGVDFEFSFLKTLGIIFVYLLEALLYIAIALWFSCFIPGFFNVFLLAGWMFLDSSIIKGVLMMLFSDSKFFSIFSEFFFPTGLSESVTILTSKGIFPWEALTWGIAGLTLFLTLSFWHINYIKIDTNTD